MSDALEPEYGDSAFNCGYQHGAAVAFGLIGMAHAIRDAYLCPACGSWEGRGPFGRRQSCQCENDE